ncbi:MAG: hypothetical protein V2A76_15710 [Planctomycetota bacterium]
MTGSLADEAAGKAVQMAGAGLYFLVLGAFHLVRDPRLEEFEDSREEGEGGVRPKPVLWQGSVRVTSGNRAFWGAYPPR